MLRIKSFIESLNIFERNKFPTFIIDNAPWLIEV